MESLGRSLTGWACDLWSLAPTAGALHTAPMTGALEAVGSVSSTGSREALSIPWEFLTHSAPMGSELPTQVAEPSSGFWSWTENRKSRLRSEEHTSELQSLRHIVCRLLL